MPTPAELKKSTSNNETKDLQQLLAHLKTPVSKQQLPSIKHDVTKQNRGSAEHWPATQPKSGAHQLQSSEALALEQFNTKYCAERNFSKHPYHDRFREVFKALITQRLCSRDWISWAPPENILRVLMCLRILMRDSTYQKHFFQLDGVKVLSEHFSKATHSYLYHGDGPCVVDILKEMTNIFQKLSSVVEQQEWLIACGAHKSLVLLLSANDVIVLHCSLHALISLAQSPKPRLLIGELNCVEQLLRIIQEYDNVSKKHSASLLRLLSQDGQCRELVKSHDGVPILLSQLQGDNVNLLYHVVWCLAQLCRDIDMSKDVRQMGGIPLLLSLLHDRSFVTERNETSGCASAGTQGRTPSGGDDAEELMELQYSLKSACCAALAELVLIDTNAQQIVQANGIYSLGLLILPPAPGLSNKERKAAQSLQRFAFRTLRFLFSMERNRRLFKRLFPVNLYPVFIDIGHYNHDLSAYKHLVQAINSLPSEEVSVIHDSMFELNQNRTPTHHIHEYAVFEHLGTGAFGSVYKVRKRAGQSFVALKEINLLNPGLGLTSSERDVSVGQMANELQIMRQDMRHTNIVRYHKTFREAETLYIVMDLIEGAPLDEHFNSLKEKRSKFTEGRIWDILMQMILALRYLHKDKGIVHRDLTPKNIMLGENDKVTITDFGLAKVRGDASKMTSVCGTILYSCPEMVEGRPYGEKADMWALGCVLYQMCTLEPPFFNHSTLALAKSIVEANYKPIPAGTYSPRLIETVKSCICASADERPDIVQLGAQLSDILLKHMDTLQSSQNSLEKKLERERKRTQKHFVEANQNMQNYHRLFLVSQERYDKLANLAGSGGASGFKDNGLGESGYTEEQVSPSLIPRNNQEADDITEHVSGSWSSDEESYPSSDNESRGSRENSAGSTRGKSVFHRNKTLSQLPPTPTPRNRDHQYQQLTVDIPNTAKTSRDSGFGSGDPSPNHNSPNGSSLERVNGHGSGDSRRYHRSNSSPTVNSLTRGNKKSSSKQPKSANTATLTISNRRVRQISDPITQMLHILHKIIYITQLPPTLNPNPKRRIIERFKRALFAPQSSSFNLKGELHKLNMGSRDIIDLNLGPRENNRVNSAGSDHRVNSAGSDKGGGSTSSENSERGSGFKHVERFTSAQHDGDDAISYEQLQSMIETVLVECGYYSVSPNSRERTPPLGPITPESMARSRLSMHLS